VNVTDRWVLSRWRRLIERLTVHKQRHSGRRQGKAEKDDHDRLSNAHSSV
jgi:hypothetical protein